MIHKRSWRLHPLSLGFALLLLGSLSLVNLNPRVRLGYIGYIVIKEDDEFAHGWPLVYMRRDWRVANADMGGLFHGPWPFSEYPGPVRHFRIDCLIYDIVAAVLLTGVTVMCLELSLRVRDVQLRFGLKTLLTITAAAGIWLAIEHVFPLHLVALYLIPYCVVISSLLYVCFVDARNVCRHIIMRSAQ